MEAMARRDLPPSQFLYELKNLGLYDLVEISGVIGLSMEPKVLHYVPPNSKKIKLDMFTGYTKSSTDSTLHLQPETEEFRELTSIIFWHTHPGNHNRLSRGDITTSIAACDKIEALGKQFYSVLFLPFQNRSYWYQFRRL